MKIEIVGDKARLVTLKDEWNRWLAEERLVTPFTTFEWLHSCVDAFGDGKELSLLLFREEGDGRIAGIAPMWLRKAKHHGLEAKELAFIGCPDTPCSDFIVPAGREGDVLEAFVRKMFGKEGGGFDLLVLEKIPASSPCLAYLNGCAERSRIQSFQGYPTRNSYVEIEGDWELFVKGRSERFRKTRRNIANRIGKMEGVEIVTHESDDQGTLMDDVLEVSRNGWKAREGLAISSREDFTKFFRQMTQWASRRRMLYVWILRVGGKPVAMEYDLKHDKKVYALRADYHEDYKNISPGAYLEFRLVEFLFRNGFREYNMGPGTNEYKSHWTEKAAEHLNVYFCNRTWKGSLIWWVRSVLLPLLRTLKRRLKAPEPSGEGESAS